MNIVNHIKVTALLTYLLMNPCSIISQSLVLDGEVSKSYDLSSEIIVEKNDVILSSYRLRNNSMLDSIVFKDNQRQSISTLINNKVLLSENEDTIAYYKGSKLYFPKQNEVIEVVTHRDGFLNLRKEGWSFVSQSGNDTIAQFNYRLDESKQNYEIICTYRVDSELAISALKVGIARFDKHVNMDYKASSGASIFFGILTAGLIAN